MRRALTIGLMIVLGGTAAEAQDTADGSPLDARVARPRGSACASAGRPSEGVLPDVGRRAYRDLQNRYRRPSHVGAPRASRSGAGHSRRA